MDLISRQAAIDAAIEAADEWDGGCNIEREKLIESYISKLPSVQPKLLQPWEVLVAQAVLPQPKRGRWIKTARWGRVYYCDQCRNYLDFDGVNAGRGSTNFCPNCGAKMEK